MHLPQLNNVVLFEGVAVSKLVMQDILFPHRRRKRISHCSFLLQRSGPAVRGDRDRDNNNLLHHLLDIHFCLYSFLRLLLMLTRMLKFFFFLTLLYFFPCKMKMLENFSTTCK